MSQAAIVLWIVGAPLVVAVIDLVRTLSSLRNAPASAPGLWSRTLGINRPQTTPSAADRV